MNVIKNESGRSIIEMLGVLAIIGVLSIVGLVGYSKAIDRYKVNETISQITYIVYNTRDLFKAQSNFYKALSFDYTPMSTTTSDNRKLAEKGKIFPASLIKNNYRNLFDGDIKFYAGSRFVKDDGKAFLLVFYSLPQEVCIELATRDWQSSLGLILMNVIGSKQYYYTSKILSSDCTTACKEGNCVICAKNMPATLEQAVTACNYENNTITWEFY